MSAWTVTVLGKDHTFATEEAADAFRKLLPDTARSTQPREIQLHTDPYAAFDTLMRRQTTPIDTVVHDTGASKGLMTKVVPVVKWAVLDGLGRRQSNRAIADEIRRMLGRVESRRIWWVAIGTDYELQKTEHLEEVRITFNDLDVTVLTELHPAILWKGE